MTYSTPDAKKKFYGSVEWIWLRGQRLKLDNYECQQCKREGRVTLDSKKEEGKKKEIVLNVHHKKLNGRSYKRRATARCTCFTLTDTYSGTLVLFPCCKHII